eukprot:scaffold253416_cov32-Tisochrysis_lutea.AAC.4
MQCAATSTSTANSSLRHRATRHRQNPAVLTSEEVSCPCRAPRHQAEHRPSAHDKRSGPHPNPGSMPNKSRGQSRRLRVWRTQYARSGSPKED